MGLEAPVKVWPPGDTVTVYDVIGLPPFKAGAVNDTETCELPDAAETLCGTDGIVTGVILTAGEETGLIPAEFAAVT
jgi:hypothetical protein